MNRTDAGPYIVLGVDKDADSGSLPARCADRQEAAQSGDLNWMEDDLVWALEQLRDMARRPAIDAACFNTDIASGEVRRLARLYRVDGTPPDWETLDPEPPAELPEVNFDTAKLATDLPLPEVSLEIPSVSRWLERFADIGTDPWAVDLTA